jgi:ABC-type branched-subunit amino acid transport system permease subunit
MKICADNSGSFRITGHYFALLTLALSAIVLQVITATRNVTGGSLGYTPERPAAPRARVTEPVRYRVLRPVGTLRTQR